MIKQILTANKYIGTDRRTDAFENYAWIFNTKVYVS